MQSAPATRKTWAAQTEANYAEAWQQLVKSAADTDDATLFKLVAVAASSRRLIRSMKRTRIKRLYLVPGSYQLTAYNIVAAAARQFSFSPKSQTYQQWCAREGVKQGAMADILAGVAALHAEFGYALPESHQLAPVRAGSPEAWQFIDHLMAGHRLRLLHQGYHDDVGPITGKGKVPGVEGMAIGEIIPVNVPAPQLRYRFEGTTVPLELLRSHAVSEIVDLRGTDEAGQVLATVDVVYDNRTVIEQDAHFTQSQLKHAAFSNAVQLHYDVVCSGLWKVLPDILPPHTRLVAEFNGRHMRGTPVVMREHIRRYLQEQLLHHWHYPPSIIELPRLTAEYPVIRKVVAATIGSDPLTGAPLKAYGTVGQVQHSSQSGPFFGVRWVLDRDAAKQLRSKAIEALAPTIARLKQLRRLDHADAVQQAAAVAEIAERLARITPPVAPAETLRRLQKLPHPAVAFTAHQTREWAKEARDEIEEILKAAHAKQKTA